MLQVTSFRSLLRDAAALFGTSPFLIDDDAIGPVSYATLLRFARGLEAHFDELGIPVGAPVATLFHNCGIAALLFLATIASRRIFVPLNPISTSQEQEYMLERAHCALVLVDPSHPKSDYYTHIPNLKIENHRTFFERICALGDTSRVSEGNESESTTFPAEVVFTSGSTGRPKGIVLSERALISNAAALAQVYELCSEDRFLTVCPLFHNSGQVLTTLACALVGGSTVAVKSDVGMLHFWHYVDRYRAGWSLGMLSFLAMLLARPESPAEPHVMRGLLTGGSAVDGALVGRFETRFGVPVRTVYGLTESASISTCEFRDPSPRSLGSSGRPLPICDVRIGPNLDSLAAFNEPAAQDPGEIWICGPNLFDEYLGDPELTRKRRHGNWLQTGDLGHFDRHGNLFVVDRLDSMLIVGGENVYPSEVERLCASLPDAAQIVLTGVHEPIWGSKLVLVYKCVDQTQPSLYKWHRILSSEVAAFKLPQQYVSVQELGLVDFPRKENGKLDRQAIMNLVRTKMPATERNNAEDHA